jgi:hypothetical protein
MVFTEGLTSPALTSIKGLAKEKSSKIRNSTSILMTQMKILIKNLAQEDYGMHTNRICLFSEILTRSSKVLLITRNITVAFSPSLGL